VVRAKLAVSIEFLLTVLVHYETCGMILALNITIVTCAYRKMSCHASQCVNVWLWV